MSTRGTLSPEIARESERQSWVAGYGHGSGHESNHASSHASGHASSHASSGTNSHPSGSLHQQPAEDPGPAFSIARFLESEQQKDMLRLSTAGSVDDGKSTLIGRLLYDSRNVYLDHVQSVTKTQGGSAPASIDFAQLTDGLRAEREQGITIDVAYRYFSTERRKFIIADTPGHEQYTRNMATGASTADLAIILIDASKGILTQSRRHVYITSLLGIRHLVAAINKMDLVDFSPQVFGRIEQQFAALVAQLGGAKVKAIPLAALAGDNVVEPSRRMPWYSGPTLLEHLESVPTRRQSQETGFRLPVQRVIRPRQNHAQPNFRGFAGQIAAGTVHVGDRVIALPSGRSTRVSSITTFEGDLGEASSPQSVAIALEDEFDISRGDCIAAVDRPPQIGSAIEASLVWFDLRPLDTSRLYLMKHASQTVGARVKAIRHKINVRTLERETVDSLAMNDIGKVEIATLRPIFFDRYLKNRATGSFILIDADTNATAAAGMIEGSVAGKVEENRRSQERVPNAPVLLVGDAGLAVKLETALLDAGFAAIRTRVCDARLWRDLAALGVCTLVDTEQQETIGVQLANYTDDAQSPTKHPGTKHPDTKHPGTEHLGTGPLNLERLFLANSDEPARNAAEIVEALRGKGFLSLKKGNGSPYDVLEPGN